jgi:pre-mRNA-splicing helicase BRR2
LQGVTHHHLSDHLSQLVEQTLEDLHENKCILVEEDAVSPLNLGMIAAFYYINYRTIQAFSLSLRSRTRLQVLLDIISGAVEFENIPIRHHEDAILDKIHDKLPRKYPDPNFNDPHFKTSLLLQAHFSRFQLPPDLESDQKLILSKIIRLLQACVDVISSNGWLNPALSAMELSQMCVQAIWDKDSPLKQIPHFSRDIIQRLTEKGVEDVPDLLEMDPKELDSDLQLSNMQMRDVIRFVNNYPNIEVAFKLHEKSVTSGDTCTLEVVLERETEDTDIGSVIAPFYPGKKEEGWWLVVGDPETKALLAIKRIALQLKLSVMLEFEAPEREGTIECKLYLMSDSFMGCDQEFEFEMDIKKDENQDGDIEME